jgi:3-oxoacyl-(acyl-carrier-protein) synthase
MYAASQIAKGAAPAALAGGIEETNEMIYSVLDRIGTLAHAEDSRDEAVRPFDRRRNGLLPGEGSAIFVLDGGSAPYGYLSGFGIARDTSASISDWGENPDAVVAAMRAAIEDAGIGIEDVSAVYASANSTIRADRLEQRAIAALFGHAVPVVATKGVFGEYAAGGALVLAAAALAVRDQAVHASVGFESGEQDTLIDVNRVRREMVVRNVLVNSISAGGGIVSAVVSQERQ